MNNNHLLEIRDLKTYFFTYEGVARAVDGVSYQLAKGEPLGVVGESGCGKSVTALSVLRIIPVPPGKVVGGEILFKRQNLLRLPEDEMRKIRGNRISMIFQEPMTSLNPVFTVGNLKKYFPLKGGSSVKPWATFMRWTGSVFPWTRERALDLWGRADAGNRRRHGHSKADRAHGRGGCV